MNREKSKEHGKKTSHGMRSWASLKGQVLLGFQEGSLEAGATAKGDDFVVSDHSNAQYFSFFFSASGKAHFSRRRDRISSSNSFLIR